MGSKDSLWGKKSTFSYSLPTPILWFWCPFLYLHHFPGGSVGKESACNAGDPGSTPGSGRSPGEGDGNPLQYPMDRAAWWALVHGVTKSRTWLSDWCFSLCIFMFIIFCSLLLSSLSQKSFWFFKNVCASLFKWFIFELWIFLFSIDSFFFTASREDFSTFSLK